MLGILKVRTYGFVYVLFQTGCVSIWCVFQVAQLASQAVVSQAGGDRDGACFKHVFRKLPPRMPYAPNCTWSEFDVPASFLVAT